MRNKRYSLYFDSSHTIATFDINSIIDDDSDSIELPIQDIEYDKTFIQLGFDSIIFDLDLFFNTYTDCGILEIDRDSIDFTINSKYYSNYKPLVPLVYSKYIHDYSDDAFYYDIEQYFNYSKYDVNLESYDFMKFSDYYQDKFGDSSREFLSLNGNTCKFKDSDTVTLSIDSRQYEVVGSFHAIVSNNTYTTIYQLRSDGTTTYAPESLLTLHVEDSMP